MQALKTLPPRPPARNMSISNRDQIHISEEKAKPGPQKRQTIFASTADRCAQPIPENAPIYPQIENRYATLQLVENKDYDIFYPQIFCVFFDQPKLPQEPLCHQGFCAPFAPRESKTTSLEHWATGPAHESRFTSHRSRITDCTSRIAGQLRATGDALLDTLRTAISLTRHASFRILVVALKESCSYRQPGSEAR